MSYKMRVFNEDKTQELTTYDLELGRLKNDTLTHTIPEVKEVAHIIKDEETGYEEVIIETPYQPAKEEIEHILVYIPYGQDVIDHNNMVKRIAGLKSQLEKNDYIGNKISEELLKYIISEDKDKTALEKLYQKYFEALEERESCRNEINAIELQLKD